MVLCLVRIVRQTRLASFCRHDAIMSLADQIAQSKKGLKKTETVVRTKEGRVYKERLDDNGNVVKDELESKVDFIPIEAAPDPDVCGPLTSQSVPVLPFLFLGSQDAAVNIEGLKAKGVTHILNVATGISNAFPEVKWMNDPIDFICRNSLTKLLKFWMWKKP